MNTIYMHNSTIMTLQSTTNDIKSTNNITIVILRDLSQIPFYYHSNSDKAICSSIVANKVFPKYYLVKHLMHQYQIQWPYEIYPKSQLVIHNTKTNHNVIHQSSLNLIWPNTLQKRKYHNPWRRWEGKDPHYHGYLLSPINKEIPPTLKLRLSSSSLWLPCSPSSNFFTASFLIIPKHTYYQSSFPSNFPIYFSLILKYWLFHFWPNLINFSPFYFLFFTKTSQILIILFYFN